jgi:hypothetical protein
MRAAPLRSMIDHGVSRLIFRRLLVLASFVVALVQARPAPATTILPLDLDALTAAAGRVFMGRVVAVRSGRDRHGLPATWTTFAVDEALKGTSAKRIEIKQLGVATPLPDGTVFRVPALPSYRVGDEVILFLQPESREGFTSPVGFGQGRFRIHHDGTGAVAVAENDVGNINLSGATTGAASTARARAEPVAPSAANTTPPTAAPLAVDDLLARIRASARASH